MSDEEKDKFIQNKLPESDLRNAGENLTPEERTDLVFELGVRNAVEQHHREDLRKSIQSFEERYQHPRKSNRTISWSAAASIVLVTAALLLFNQKPPYEKYYESYPNFEYTTTRGEETGDLKAKAYGLYDEANFETAIPYFSELIESDPDASAPYMFRGMCYIETGQFDEAIEDFQRVTDHTYRDDAKWYCALANIHEGRNDKAKVLLKDLEDSSIYQTKARNLLNDL